MKRNGIINADISRVLAYMGHTDTLAVGDCGLPIPDETERIDLALKPGVPSFMEVLAEIAKDMKIEKITLAEEIREKNKDVLEEILALVNEMDTECNMYHTQNLKPEQKPARQLCVQEKQHHMQILSCSQHACSEIFRENFKIPCISRLSSFKKIIFIGTYCIWLAAWHMKK